MTEARERIMEQLRRIESEEQVKILYACESGSRAWGFPSRDSDYDVRFIYIRPVDWYVSIFDRRDVIERPISCLLDINGWDMKKALLLFRKSNPPLLEWLHSPIRYMESPAAERIRSIAGDAFSPRSCIYHYLHMAKRNYREYLQGDLINIKKYFYVLRPILACEWTEKRGTMAPVAFPQLVRAILPEDSELKRVILHLLERKIAGDEMDLEPRIEPINAYIEEKIAYYEQAASAMPEAGSEPALDRRLDEMFRSVLQNVWDR